MWLIALLACSGPSLDPSSREPQPVEAPWGDVVTVLPSPEGPVLVTSGGAVRLGARVAPVEVPAPAALPPAPEGRFLRGASGSLAVGGGPGPHGEHDGWLLSLDGGSEAWLGGPEWEVLHAVAPFGEGWLVAGVGVDRRGPVEVAGAVWIARLDAALAPLWQRRFHGGQDHVATVVPVGDRAVVLALGGDWNDSMKPLTGWVVRADGTSEPLAAELGRVRTVAAAADGPGRIILATSDQAGRHYVRWLDVP